MPYNYDGEDEILDPESRHNNVKLVSIVNLLNSINKGTNSYN